MVSVLYKKLWVQQVGSPWPISKTEGGEHQLNCVKLSARRETCTNSSDEYGGKAGWEKKTLAPCSSVLPEWIVHLNDHLSIQKNICKSQTQHDSWQKQTDLIFTCTVSESRNAMDNGLVGGLLLGGWEYTDAGPFRNSPRRVMSDLWMACCREASQHDNKPEDRGGRTNTLK